MNTHKPSPVKLIGSPVGAEIILDGRRYINFGGSSYLGLSSNQQILEAGVAALRECGAGIPMPSDQQVVTAAHREVERQAAAFFDTQAALYLASGYLVGLIAIAAIKHEFAAIFYDELAHYSLREAIAASGLRSFAYKHLDADDLESKVSQHLRAHERPLVATDGMFPTFGEIAPLDALWAVVRPFSGRLLIDESHSFGVIGPSGRGAAELYALPASAVIIGGSLGKAFGTYGGIIPASEAEVATFRAAPAGRGASPGLPAAAAMCAASLLYVREHPVLLSRLRANVTHLKAGLRNLGLEVSSSVAPVATFVTGPGKSMQQLKDQLLADGIFVYYTNYIGAGAVGVIRCGIFADHKAEHIDTFLAALQRHL